MKLQTFHLAFPVSDLEAARYFYSEVLGCQTGRESERWIDFNFFGHQIVAHLVDSSDPVMTNLVDDQNVPVRHFGLVLDWESWEKLAHKLKEAHCQFLITPHIRFQGKVGEQATFFITDPSGNALEFKAFRNPDELFKKDPSGELGSRP